MRESGSALANPASGSWRIPGVYTPTEYYRDSGRFRGPGYQPRPGDVVLCSPGWRFRQHTNIVVVNDDGELTTIGGNEGGINVGSVKADDRGIVGFGLLPASR